MYNSRYVKITVFFTVSREPFNHLVSSAVDRGTLLIDLPVVVWLQEKFIHVQTGIDKIPQRFYDDAKLLRVRGYKLSMLSTTLLIADMRS